MRGVARPEHRKAREDCSGETLGEDLRTRHQRESNGVSCDRFRPKDVTNHKPVENGKEGSDQAGDCDPPAVTHEASKGVGVETRPSTHREYYGCDTERQRRAGGETFLFYHAAATETGIDPLSVRQ